MNATFPKKNNKRYAGSVIGIPLGGLLVQTLVLWHSSYFKNLILLAPTDRLVPVHPDTTELGFPITLFFTGAQFIRAGWWKYQGATVLQVPPIVCTFISAKRIFRGDQDIGPVGAQ